MNEGIDRSTLGIASAILVLTTLAGMLVAAPPGIILGPVVDKFLTPHLLSKRGYVSPGPPLWSVAVGGLALLPALASGSPSEATRDMALVTAVSAGLGAIILGVFALRGRVPRMGAIGIGFGISAVLVSIVLHGAAS